MKLKGGFECDIPQKELVKQILNKLFSGYTITYDIENENNKMAPVDMIFTATSNSNELKYAIELKQRLKDHTDYNGDWVINDEKYDWLKRYKSSGYSSYYLCTFNDGYYAIWSIDDIEKYHTEDTFYIKPHTQADWNEKRVPQHRLIINNKYAKLLEKYDKYRNS